jgi:tetratricopeptide (TPR) repeat protein
MANARADSRQLVAVFVTGIVAMVLAFAGWRAYTLSIANFWAEHSPAKSLQIRPSFPRAEFAKAERGIRAGESPLKFEQDAGRALGDSPLDGRGFRFLASAAEARGDRQQAVRLYDIAAQRSPRDLPSVAWLGDEELRRGDYRAALARLDRIIRVEPQRLHKLQAVLVQIASTPAAKNAFADSLASHPPWRGKIFNLVLLQGDVAAVFPLVERVRSTPGGMSPKELATWIDRLATAGQWGPAYLTWVQSLSPEESSQIGNVFNGSFEHEPGQGGFDWRFQDVAGAHISREQTTGAQGNLALRVAFYDDRVPFRHVRQLLALPPGPFRLSGRVRLDDLRSERGLVWSIMCAGQRSAIAQTEPFSGVREWASFAPDFEVPAQSCGGQWLALSVPARIPAEQRIGGVAWFDDLKIKAR